MLVDALRGEVQLRVDEFVKLNEQVRISKDENSGLEETIKVRENDVNEMRRQASTIGLFLNGITHNFGIF